MAKKKATRRPRVKGKIERVQSKFDPVTTTVAQGAPVTNNGHTVINIPPLPPEVDTSTQYALRKVNARLTSQQAQAMKRLHLALDESGARLASGHRVRSNVVSDAVRWLLDQVS